MDTADTDHKVRFFRVAKNSSAALHQNVLLTTFTQVWWHRTMAFTASFFLLHPLFYVFSYAIGDISELLSLFTHRSSHKALPHGQSTLLSGFGRSRSSSTNPPKRRCQGFCCTRGQMSATDDTMCCYVLCNVEISIHRHTYKRIQTALLAQNPDHGYEARVRLARFHWKQFFLEAH